jgi:hypothetical protein
VEPDEHRMGNAETEAQYDPGGHIIHAESGEVCPTEMEYVPAIHPIQSINTHFNQHGDEN